MILLSTLESFLQLIGVLIIFLFVLAITYFTTRWIAGYQKTQIHNKNIRIVETLKVSPNNYVEIVKAGEKYLVLGIAKDRVELLTTLDQDEVIEREDDVLENVQIQESFQQVLDKLKEKLPKK